MLLTKIRALKEKVTTIMDYQFVIGTYTHKSILLHRYTYLTYSASNGATGA